ncbi:MAG: cytochrome c1 [Pseudomonadota bacterium]|nr:cytochrome c1 [Pseudomonadota bacterium]
MNQSLKRLISRVLVIAAASLPVAAFAAGDEYPLDPFPTGKLNDPASLQNGAKLFVNYCLSCHSASAMRYNRLQDIGLNDDQIKANLLFTAEKVGDPMTIAMRPADAKEWFGAAPPDLSLIARSRASHAGTGADWLFTYLRAYYRDDTTLTGWNNALFPNVGMPNVFWQQQGTRTVTIEDVKAGADHRFTREITRIDAQGAATTESEPVEGHPHAGRTIKLSPPVGGTQSRAEFDENMADLVAYITYMSDPTARKRTQLGVWVLLYLGLLFVAAWVLNKAFWKDVR